MRLDVRHVAAPAVSAPAEDRRDVVPAGRQIGSSAGNVLLSRYPLVSSSTTLLSYNRGVAQITIVVNGSNVNLFSTHVDYENASWRTIQIAEAIGGSAASRSRGS